MSKQYVWSGQGPIYLGDYDPDNGTAEMGYITNLYKIGCANSALTVTPNRSTTIIKESCSGSRLDLDEIETALGLTVNLTMQQYSRDELALALYGTNSLVASGSITDEALPTVADDDYAFLKHPATVASLVITDSDGTPATLVADTNYQIIDANQGIIQFLDVAGFTQPFKCAYDHAAYGNIAVFENTGIRKGLVYTGKNQDGDRARVIIPNLSMAPGGAFSLLSPEPTDLQLTGMAFYVPLLEGDTSYGKFMRVDNLPE